MSTGARRDTHTHTHTHTPSAAELLVTLEETERAEHLEEMNKNFVPKKLSTIGEITAAIRMQAAWRGFSSRRKTKRLIAEVSEIDKI